MNVTEASLLRIEQHWAMEAIGDVALKQATELTNQILVDNAVGHQIQFGFLHTQEDYALLEKVAVAYELAAIEGLNDFLSTTTGNSELREQCATGAFRAFEIRRLFDLPEPDEEKINHILHLSALAYCGDRWSDLRRWYTEYSDLIRVPSVADVAWDRRLLYRVFECWVRLFRKKRWDDLDRIREIIAGLRHDQQQYEPDFLDGDQNAENRAMAFRLVSLYHWAKATEVLSVYMLQGEPADVVPLLNKHFESAIEAAEACADSQLEVLLRWLHVAARQMVVDSLWWVARRINSRVTNFVGEVTKQQALFELLPPQRAAIVEEGLLDPAASAIVVDMPTSGGKTLLAQFRILQALNQFDRDESGKGWVAYVAPTKALTAQITRRLRRDFEPIGVKVEQLTGAIDIDAFEGDLLSETDASEAFDVLVATPEKLQLVIRNKRVSRPLALVVMDEAHNIEDKDRGLRFELLLATIKAECTTASFLLLTPYVENPEVLARWLAHDIGAGRPISLGTTPWKPNERIVGMYKAVADDQMHAGWRLEFETLATTPKTIHLSGTHSVGPIRPIDVPRSKVLKNGEQSGFLLQTAGMASVLSARGTSIAVALNTNWVWSMARNAFESLPDLHPVNDDIRLVQDFLRTEISPSFELVELLSRGVGVHHSGLSDEARALMEWLAEQGHLSLLCTTTTIAQGINFPVSSVFLASRMLPYGNEMSPRDFWNLAGRAGRMGHDSVGVVGLAAGKEPEKIVRFVSTAIGSLASRLVEMLDDLEQVGRLNDLQRVFQDEQWEDFRCYVAHLWSEKKNLDAVLADTEQLLRNTFGYGLLENDQNSKQKAAILLQVTKDYARALSSDPGRVNLADMTGFSPEGIGVALAGVHSLEYELTIDDWKPESLFGPRSAGMADLYGIMLRIPQLRSNLEQLTGEGPDQTRIADITKAWVGGMSIDDIARRFFAADGDSTKAITETCKAIYRRLVNNGTWGMSALSRISGLDFEEMSDIEKRQINMIPAMIYHGVHSEEAVLLRMNSVPRSVAESLGSVMASTANEDYSTIRGAREFLRQSPPSTWDQARPQGSHLSGHDYKRVWEILSGDSR